MELAFALVCLIAVTLIIALPFVKEWGASEQRNLKLEAIKDLTTEMAVNRQHRMDLNRVRGELLEIKNQPRFSIQAVTAMFLADFGDYGITDPVGSAVAATITLTRLSTMSEEEGQLWEDEYWEKLATPEERAERDR